VYVGEEHTRFSHHAVSDGGDLARSLRPVLHGQFANVIAGLADLTSGLADVTSGFAAAGVVDFHGGRTCENGAG